MIRPLRSLLFTDKRLLDFVTSRCRPATAAHRRIPPMLVKPYTARPAAR